MTGTEHDTLMEGAAAGTAQRVAVITGGSQGIGAGLVAGYRQRGWAVVANARDQALRGSGDSHGRGGHLPARHG
jgi:NAD(P)-dependent dehydrogenase (short-subunit alcohol dehydrogenase family)